MLGRDRFLRWVFRPVRGQAVRVDQAEVFVARKTAWMAIAAGIGALCLVSGTTAILIAGEGLDDASVYRAMIVVLNAAWLACLWFVMCLRAALIQLIIHIECYGMTARLQSTPKDARSDLSKAMGTEATPA